MTLQEQLTAATKSAAKAIGMADAINAIEFELFWDCDAATKLERIKQRIQSLKVEADKLRAEFADNMQRICRDAEDAVNMKPHEIGSV